MVAEMAAIKEGGEHGRPQYIIFVRSTLTERSGKRSQTMMIYPEKRLKAHAGQKEVFGFRQVGFFLHPADLSMTIKILD